MPLYDFKCNTCLTVERDVIMKNSTDKRICGKCKLEMERLICSPNFKIVGGSISTHLKKYGQTGYQETHNPSAPGDNGVRFFK